MKLTELPEVLNENISEKYKMVTGRKCQVYVYVKKRVPEFYTKQKIKYHLRHGNKVNENNISY